MDELTFGFSDAENYSRRENKALFEKIFLRTAAVDKLLSSSTYFLIGEKGTGKTAYAVHLSNTDTHNQFSAHKYVRETDYIKFLKLKKLQALDISEYTDILRCIFLLLTAQGIYQRLGIADQILQYRKFSKLNEAISSYYGNAFSPEISFAFKLVEHSKNVAEALVKSSGMQGKIGTEHAKTRTDEKNSFQINLAVIEREIREAIASLKLPKDFNLFIDGIDLRPSNIPYQEYLECVKGLANAAWSLNNDFFPSIKDSPGRIKVVTLLRPDILTSLGLQNTNTKIEDNSVVLRWIADYKTHRSSEIFKLADRFFSSQQDEKHNLGVCWDNYFPFHRFTG